MAYKLTADILLFLLALTNKKYMITKVSFEIIESDRTLSTFNIKFGGQPNWLSQPFWPIDPETDKPMRFFAQIPLISEVFPNSNDSIVYIFIGENEILYDDIIGIVIQTREQVFKSSNPFLEFISNAEGPSVYTLGNNDTQQAIPKEYIAQVDKVESEKYIPLRDRYKITDFEYEIGYFFSHPQISGNKIGGQPLYLGGSNPPEEFISDEWLLLLQLAPKQGYYTKSLKPNFYPFSMNLGDFGILTIFISKDYTRATSFVQYP